MTTQRIKRLVAQAGIEPTAQAYETRMLPLHYRAASPTVGTIGLEPIQAVLQTAALPLELYSRIISPFKKSGGQGTRTLISTSVENRISSAAQQTNICLSSLFLFNAERVTGPLQCRSHWITKGL